MFCDLLNASVWYIGRQSQGRRTMYPPTNQFFIPLLIAEDERRQGRERATTELLRPTTHRALVIGRLASRLLRGRAVASMVLAKPRPGPTQGQ
jgi:hypothetical protein